VDIKRFQKGIGFHRKSISELQSVTCHVELLSVTCHHLTLMNVLCLNSTRQVGGTQFACHGRMEGWVDLDVDYIPRWRHWS